ncbi:MAG: hypothetical protein FJ295_07350 [Planctomycetes bacterium]|nr:hypothetical protein [Planctomycetota bacterium]
MILMLCLAAGGSPAPDANEAHYLSKARHYWNPGWCAGDPFLESADAHVVFYWTFGWVASLLPFPVAAWLGRLITWTMLALAWQRLSRAICPLPWHAVLSAGLLIAGVQLCHFGGEWLIGGVEAKGFAFAAVFLALERMLRNRWNTAALLLGIATSLHVLVGGWSLVAAAGAWWGCGSFRPKLSRLAPGLAAGCALALPGLIPALLLTWGTPGEIVDKANLIYVYQRLAHHLVFHRIVHDHATPFLPLFRHLILLAIWAMLSWRTPCVLSQGQLGQRPVRGFVGSAVAIAIAGALLDQLLLPMPSLSAAILRYYWFRLSDVALPAGLALTVVGLLRAYRDAPTTLSRSTFSVALLCVLANLAANVVSRGWEANVGSGRAALGGAEFALKEHPQLYRQWRDCCAWIREHTPADARCLTPRWQQTFKWFAERSEVVTWKDIPQDARSVVAWWERLEEACPPVVSAGGIAALSDEQILELARRYEFQFIVVDKWLGQREFGFRRVYPLDKGHSEYEVYELPRSIQLNDPVTRIGIADRKEDK